MYLSHFQLNQEPFQITPDPTFLFLSRSHKDVYATLHYAVANRKGLIVLTGEVGTGKTILIRSFLEARNRDCIHPIYIFHSKISFHDLIVTLCSELGIECSESFGDVELLRQIHYALIDQFQQGKTIVLIIDEAQHLPKETLLHLRMLFNLDLHRQKLLQIILVGQPELDDKLNQHSMRALRDCVTMRAMIKPLSHSDSYLYIKHRLSCCQYCYRPLFDRTALKGLIRRAGGIPRKINILCDNALLAAWCKKKKKVTLRILNRVLRSLGYRPLPMLRTRYAIALAITLGLYGLTSTQLEWANLSNIEMASVPFVAKSVVSETGASARLVESSNLHASAWKTVNPSSVFDDSIVKATSSEVLTQSIPTVPCLSSPEHEPATWVASASSEKPIGPGAEQHPVEPLSMNLSDATPLIHSKGVDELFDKYISTPKDTDRSLFPKRIQVQEGDTLSQLCNEVYGMVSAQLLREIMVSNPRLQDENRILKGHWLVFPAPPQDFHKFNSIEKDGNV